MKATTLLETDSQI